MTDSERLDFYRVILANLCKQHGGEIFIPVDEGELTGSIYHRFEPSNGGVRFMFVKDEDKN